MIPHLEPILFDTDEPFLTEAQVDDLTAFVVEGLTDRALALSDNVSNSQQRKWRSQ